VALRRLKIAAEPSQREAALNRWTDECRRRANEEAPAPWKPPSGRQRPRPARYDHCALASTSVFILHNQRQLCPSATRSSLINNSRPAGRQKRVNACRPVASADQHWRSGGISYRQSPTALARAHLSLFAPKWASVADGGRAPALPAGRLATRSRPSTCCVA
jgi:hypothetical protein